MYYRNMKILVVIVLLFIPSVLLGREFSKQEIEKMESLVRDLKPLAEEGKPAAQNNLGKMYFNGYGTEQNYEEALKWFNKAAEQNYAEAQYSMALMYFHGNGITKDLEMAKKYLTMACENGFTQGCIDMVSFVSDDNKKATYFHTKACDLGYKTSCAMLKLGEKKIEQARDILQVECEKGDKNACNILQKVVTPLIENKTKNPISKSINKIFSYVVYINIAIVGVVIFFSLIIYFFRKKRKGNQTIQDQAK